MKPASHVSPNPLHFFHLPVLSLFVSRRATSSSISAILSLTIHFFPRTSSENKRHHQNSVHGSPQLCSGNSIQCLHMRPFLRLHSFRQASQGPSWGRRQSDMANFCPPLYKHRRQSVSSSVESVCPCARQEPPGIPISNGQHRRRGLKSLLPRIRGSMDSQRGSLDSQRGSAAPSPGKSSSPFAAAQEGDDFFGAAMTSDQQMSEHGSSTAIFLVPHSIVTPPLCLETWLCALAPGFESGGMSRPNVAA